MFTGTMYVKLYSSIINSSIWSEDSDTCKVWITMLALADRDGFVFGSVSGISRISAIDTDRVNSAIEKFLGPDENSADLTRLPENEGRRIEVVEGGWKILNYSHYRDLRDADTRRSQIRQAVRKHRNHLKSNVIPSEAASESSSSSESEEERNIAHFEESFWGIFPRKVGKVAALKAWERLTDDERVLADEGVRTLADSWKARPAEELRFCPHPATWLNGKRWQDAPEPRDVALQSQNSKEAARGAAEKRRAEEDAKAQVEARREIEEIRARRKAAGLD